MEQLTFKIWATIILFTSVSANAAPSQPVHVTLMVDASDGVTDSQLNLEFQISTEILQRIHPDSPVEFWLNGNFPKNILTDIPALSAMEDVSRMSTGMERLGVRNIAASLRHVKRTLKKGAILICILAGKSNNQTELQEVAVSMTTIKMYAVGVGQQSKEMSTTLNMIGTTQNHTFEFSPDFKNYERVFTRLNVMLHRDSYLGHCNNDKYFEHNLKMCQPCKLLCVPYTARNPSCSRSCPYFNITKSSLPTTTNRNSQEYADFPETNNSLLIGWVVGGSLVLVLGVGVGVALCLWNHFNVKKVVTSLHNAEETMEALVILSSPIGKQQSDLQDDESTTDDEHVRSELSV